MLVNPFQHKAFRERHEFLMEDDSVLTVGSLMGRKNISGKLLIVLSFLITSPGLIKAQLPWLDEMPKGIFYDRGEKFKRMKDYQNFRDVFHSDKFLLGKNVFSGNVAYTTGRILINKGDATEKVWRHALTFSPRIKLFEEVYLSGTLYKDLNKRAIVPWTPDFTYTIGRYNWRPKTFSYGYENYQPNKYTDSGKILLEKMLQGNFFLSYNFVFPKIRFKHRGDSVATVYNVDSIVKAKADKLNSSKWRINYYFKYALKYRNANEETLGGGLNGKPTAGVALRYYFVKGLYAEVGTNVFLRPFQKAPWDPDFTYGFGFFDWRSFRMSATYGNYAINRFPWNGNMQHDDYGFFDGTFRVAVNFIW